MTKPIRVDAAAKAELRAAARWYDGQRPGLGPALLTAIDEAMTRMERLGADCRPVFGVDPDLGVRRVRVKRFPYAVVFIELPKGTRSTNRVGDRRPGSWRSPAPWHGHRARYGRSESSGCMTAT